MPSPFLPGDRAPPAKVVSDVASVLLPALLAPHLSALAQALGKPQDGPERVALQERHLQALTGRVLTPGGWAGGARHAGAEPLVTGRARPYGESTLRKAARPMSRAGAVSAAEAVLQQQVHDAVGQEHVTAYTDEYDQVYWTKKPAHAGPVGGLGNRVLGCTYFGLTFVRTRGGPNLGYHVSWHKPASPLIDALQALHQDPPRHDWLSEHVARHVLDRGTQGDPTLPWALSQGIPYLTLKKGSVNWRRYRHPTCELANGVPIFVRADERRKDDERPAEGQARMAVKIVFPARPSQGRENGRAIVYRTGAEVSDEELMRLDEVYKARWPHNENAIKALIAVGFEANLDRTLSPTTSRGQDGAQARMGRALDRLETKLQPLQEKAERTTKEQGQLARLLEKQASKREGLEKLQAAPASLGTRVDRGAEHLYKVLMLMVFNALALVLWRSPIEAVRTMSPVKVCQLLLWRPAVACIERGTVTLWLEPMVEREDGTRQRELVKLLNKAKLELRGAHLLLKIRDPAGKIPAVPATQELFAF